MYTFELPILYPEVALRGVTLRSVSNLNKFKLFVLESTDTVRFFVWWLFLHRRLRIRQRGSASENASDLALIWLIISKERYPFLSEQLS